MCSSDLFPAKTQEPIGDSLDEALIRHPGPDEDIDPDKIRPGGLGDGEGSEAVVSQKIDAERAREKLPGLDGQGCHGGEGARGHRTGVEGGIPEVFDDHPVGAAFFQRKEIARKDFAGFGKLAFGTGRAGQGRQMHDPDKRGARVEK